MFAIREDRTEVRMADFEAAIDKLADDNGAGEAVTSPGYVDYAY